MHDFFIMHTVDPESNSTQKSLRLFAKQIVLAVKMVTGVFTSWCLFKYLGSKIVKLHFFFYVEAFVFKEVKIGTS